MNTTDRFFNHSVTTRPITCEVSVPNSTKISFRKRLRSVISKRKNKSINIKDDSLSKTSIITPINI